MKKSPKRLALGTASVLLATTLVFGTSAAAHAATTTWFSGSVKINSKTTEGTVYQSRDGIKAGFSEYSIGGQAKITVWYGAYSNPCWAVECVQNGPRSYNKGAFKWEMPDGQTGDTMKMVGIALNVGRLGVVAPAGGGDARVTPALTSAASAYSLAPTDLVYSTSYKGIDLWTADVADTSYLFTVTPDGYATGAATPNRQFQLHGITIGIVGKSGLAEQFVLLPEAQVAVQVNSGLHKVADRLYVDTAFDSRFDDASVQLSPTLEIGLSASKE